MAKMEPILDGYAALETLAKAADQTIQGLFAANCVFLDPSTVGQTKGQAVFPIVRNSALRGTSATFQTPAGSAMPSMVMYDDNTTPTACFLWAAARTKGRDVQFNHVWTCSNDPSAYTALWNLCATPAFLAKITDGTTHAEITDLLRYRAWDLYRVRPSDQPEPPKPDGYDDLRWSVSPPAVDDLESTFRERLRGNPKSRAATAARTIGWCFNDWKPDPEIGG